MMHLLRWCITTHACKTNIYVTWYKCQNQSVINQIPWIGIPDISLSGNFPFWSNKKYYITIWCILIHQNPRIIDSIHPVYVQIIPSGLPSNNWGHNQANILNFKALKTITSHFDGFQSMTLHNGLTLSKQCVVLIGLSTPTLDPHHP